MQLIAKYPRSILEEYDLETIQSAIKMLTGYVLTKVPVSATHSLELIEAAGAQFRVIR